MKLKGRIDAKITDRRKTIYAADLGDVNDYDSDDEVEIDVEFWVETSFFDDDLILEGKSCTLFEILPNGEREEIDVLDNIDNLHKVFWDEICERQRSNFYEKVMCRADEKIKKMKGE